MSGRAQSDESMDTALPADGGPRARHVRTLLAAMGSIQAAHAIGALARHDGLERVLRGASREELGKIFGDRRMRAHLAPGVARAVAARLAGTAAGTAPSEPGALPTPASPRGCSRADTGADSTGAADA